MESVVSHLLAVALGASLVLAAMWLSHRQQGRTSRYLERQDARARSVLEADRSRWANLALQLAQGQPATAQQLTATAPAQPPGPDPALTPPDPYAAAAGLYTADPNDLPDDLMSELDDAALGIARG